MIENLGTIFIAIWVIAIILGIATNTLKLRDTLLNWYRSKKPKIKRVEFNKDASIKILNFSHPITETQKENIQELLGKSIAEIIDIQTQLDESRSFHLQICDLIIKANIKPEGLQNGQYMVNLPGFAPAAAVVLGELHGRMGHFPTIIRMKKIEGSIPPVYNVEEIIDLQAVRDKARKCR